MAVLIEELPSEPVSVSSGRVRGPTDGPLTDLLAQLEHASSSSSSSNQSWGELQETVKLLNPNAQYPQFLEFLISKLEVRDSVWDFSPIAPSAAADFHNPLSILTSLEPSLLEQQNQTLLIKLITVTTKHVKPNLPWTSRVNSQLATEFVTRESLVHIFSISEYIQAAVIPSLLNLSQTQRKGDSSLSNPKISSLSGYKSNNAAAKTGGLKPILGFSDSSVVEEDMRRAWKESGKVAALSMVWFLIEIASRKNAQSVNPGSDWFNNYWPLITSFILNVLEDHDYAFKAQGCQCLNFLIEKQTSIDSDISSNILVKSGLVDLFIDATKVCLSYLPNLTPADQSLYLLREAYPVIISLYAMKSKSKSKPDNLLFVTLINENVLTSISHIHNRSSGDGDSENSSTYPIIKLLLEQTHNIIDKQLGITVFVCLSRLLFNINQIVTNPFVLESRDQEGLKVVETCLNNQRLIFEKTLRSSQSVPSDSSSAAIEKNSGILQGSSGPTLLLEYKYDFLGVWSVLYLRLTRYIDGQEDETKGTILAQLTKNFALLQAIAESSSQTDALKTDIESVCHSNRDLKKLYLPS